MADKKTTPVTPEIEAAVGKTFAVKDADDSRRFKVIKVLPDFQFGAKGGGKQHAFEVHRVDKEGWFTPPAKTFLEGHVEVKE